MNPANAISLMSMHVRLSAISKGCLSPHCPMGQFGDVHLLRDNFLVFGSAGERLTICRASFQDAAKSLFLATLRLRPARSRTKGIPCNA